MRNAVSVVEPRLGEVLEFMRILWSLDHALQSASKRMKRDLGVTGPQRLVVRMIGQFEGVTAGGLATLLRIDPSTLTGILQRLERKGAIRRRRDPEDGRRMLFALTAKGKAIDALRTGTVEAIVRRVLGRIPDSKLHDAARLLEALTRELEAG